jgi:hypothetical protein
MSIHFIMKLIENVVNVIIIMYLGFKIKLLNFQWNVLLKTK